MTKFYDAVYSFELSIRKALHINVWVTAMAAGGEQTWSAHACDISLWARISPATLRSFTYKLSFLPSSASGPLNMLKTHEN